MLKAVGPIGRVVTATRTRKMPIVVSNTRSVPRVGISMRSLSTSFFIFSNRGVCKPAKVNILCKGRS